MRINDKLKTSTEIKKILKNGNIKEDSKLALQIMLDYAIELEKFKQENLYLNAVIKEMKNG